MTDQEISDLSIGDKIDLICKLQMALAAQRDQAEKLAYRKKLGDSDAECQ
jgi:hypothetical protein